MKTLFQIWHEWGNPSLTQEVLELFADAYEIKHGRLPSLIEIKTLILGGESLLGEAQKIAANADFCLDAQAEQNLNQKRAEVLKGVPLQYVTGKAHFFSKTYSVNPSVLIPRPETEQLVEVASRYIEKMGASRPHLPLLGVEVGLGSGCISIELLSRFNNLMMCGTESSAEAMAIAEKNGARLLSPDQYSRFVRLPIHPSMKAMPLFSIIEWSKQKLKSGERENAKIDFLISNPPYLYDSMETTPSVNAYEPQVALYPTDEIILSAQWKALDNLFHSESKGNTESLRKAVSYYLHFFEAVSTVFSGSMSSGDSRGHLADVAFPLIFLEIPHERADFLKKVAEAVNLEMKIEKDFTGRPRVAVVTKNKA